MTAMTRLPREHDANRSSRLTTSEIPNSAAAPPRHTSHSSYLALELSVSPIPIEIDPSKIAAHFRLSCSIIANEGASCPVPGTTPR